MFLTFSKISRMPFLHICDIQEFEVIGSRDTFSKLDLPEKSLKRKDLTILLSDITQLLKIRLNNIIERLFGSQSDHLYAKYVPEIKTIVSIQLRFQVDGAKLLYSYGRFMSSEVLFIPRLLLEMIFGVKKSKKYHNQASKYMKHTRRIT